MYMFNKVAYKLLRRYRIYTKWYSDNTTVLHVHES